jgi:hypothetical protein
MRQKPLSDTWHRKIMIHGSTLRMCIPLDAADLLGWRPGDRLMIELHDDPPGLLVQRHGPRRKPQETTL